MTDKAELVEFDVDEYLARIGQLFRERDKNRQGQKGASRTEHAAGKPPTAD